MKIECSRTCSHAARIVLFTFFLLGTVALQAQDRDVRGERLVLDDGAGDGGLNTLILSVPAGGLGSNRTLTFPDADGAVVTGGLAGLNADQILFGDGSGMAAQSPNLVWNSGGDVLDIGTGSFTVDASNGNVVSIGTLTLGADVPPASGFINLNDGDGGTSFLGTLTPVGVLTADRTYFLPDADGTLALVGSIVTDASLTGDGSGGSPLGIDLTNANSWTGAQTFSSVDIDGGTIDGTAIGGTSPSTGAFTTITGGSTATLGDDTTPTAGSVVLNDNAAGNTFEGTVQTAATLTADRTYTLPDADGTLALVGSIITNASLTGDGSGGSPLGIDLTNANSWTGAQTFSSVDIDGGTIDGTAIGGTSPSTGAFTTITGGSTATLGDDTTPTAGSVVLNDNAAGNTFEGTVQTAATLTADRTYTLPDADGTLALVGSIVTNASLTGDGSGGSPLGIDLTNANSWTGAQTFSSVDIDGGTIDGTAIGGTSPSTGAFTTITGGSTATLGDDTTPTAGSVVLNDNAAGNTFEGTVQTAATLTADRTYTLPDADGTLALVGSIVTDASLTGNGSGGSPLGIDLTNANTWTGTQTIGTVDINGGTVDGVAIGGTSPSTGAFTTITGGSTVTLGDDLFPTRGRVILHDNLDLNGFLGTVQTAPILTGNRTYTLPDASGTLVVSGSETVSTNASLTGDGSGGSPLGIDLTNANTWTGTQTFGTVDINGGTVDGAAIGGASPSTGAFTTITGGSTVTLGDDLFPTRGRVILHDNLDLNGFLGTVQTAPILTGNRTYTLPDADGTLALVGDIVTDASLTGNGSGGSPLGIDLTNANTWTGTQTIGTVDINGGTVDGAAIGGASPSTGAFTTITGGSTVTLGDDLFPTRGRVILHDNLDLNGFLGTVQTAPILTGNRTYTLPDASGTLVVSGSETVSTNASLTGDGSGGSPLGIDLTNANTWTGTQTFGTVDINGGTVDGAAIGGASPSTGAFTTITGGSTVTLGDDLFPTRGRVILHDNLDLNGFLGTVQTAPVLTANRTYTLPDASGTLVVSGSETVSTNASLTGDGSGGSPLGIDLTNANSWTGAQTFSSVDIDGGTVDGAAIGGASPSTGAFTTITGGSTATLGDDTTPTAGSVVLNDNAAGNTFEGTVQTVATLTADRTYTLPDADGTLVVQGTETVSTDATITGDGSGGSPLGIDLTNANSWTGAQTFSSVDIDGGTVDGAAIGGASPSTGAFTTITGGSTATLGDDTTPTAGSVVLNDNAAGNTFEGTVQTVATLTADRTYTLPDADGTLVVQGTETVSTDATLTGDGSGGSPLGIDLTNANSWTGAQTFSSVDIDGGTVDGAAIGGASPSTGAFTTITGGSTATLGDDTTPTAGSVVLNDNAAGNTFEGTVQTVATLTADRTYTLPDADGTLVVQGTETVSTDATLTGDGSGGSPLGIDLTNANSWTGAQTFSSVDIDGGTVDGAVIGGTTPAAITGTTLIANGATTVGDGDAGDVLTVNNGANTDLSITEGGVDRNSGTAETFTVDNSGAGDVSVLINGTTSVVNSRIVVNEGHWTSQGTAPTAAGDGTNLAAGVTVSGSATDVAGLVTSTDGGAAGLGVITVSFNDAYASDPIVVITPGDTDAWTAGFYVDNITTTSFDINVVTTTGDGATTYSFYYQVIEND